MLWHPQKEALGIAAKGKFAMSFKEFPVDEGESSELHSLTLTAKYEHLAIT
jgi:hypothetical protein